MSNNFEYARRVFSAVIPSVSVTQDGDSILINRYLTIDPGRVSFVRKSIRGNKVLEVNGYILALEDVIAEKVNFRDIVHEAVLFMAKEKIRDVEEAMNAEEWAEELEKERSPEFQKAVRDVLKK